MLFVPPISTFPPAPKVNVLPCSSKAPIPLFAVLEDVMLSSPLYVIFAATPRFSARYIPNASSPVTFIFAPRVPVIDGSTYIPIVLFAAVESPVTVIVPV